MPDPNGGQPSDYFRQVKPSEGADEAALRRHADLFGVSREGVLQLCAAEILNRDLGFEESARQRTGILGDGQPIPMMSYAFIEYMMGLDLTGFSVLEIGGGNSSLFWASRANKVLTLEHDRGWFDHVAAQLPANLELMPVEQDEYAQRIAALDTAFDLIVIDCAANRYDCALAVRGRLKPGGLVVLDNSDWFPNAARALREQDLIQVDFPDFRPDHWYRCNTSAFLHPEFRPKPLGGVLPAAVLGGTDLGPVNDWDRAG